MDRTFYAIHVGDLYGYSGSVKTRVLAVFSSLACFPRHNSVLYCVAAADGGGLAHRATISHRAAPLTLLPQYVLVFRQTGAELDTQVRVKPPLVNDILDQYERHLNFLHLNREAPGNTLTLPDT
ncbi:hypothetical protein JV35_01315 [Pectobacterium betavasculorum]|uniref:Uncharacterized protein n=1 Tax=Pectobacterium betavasculorum TaxID=55207 RepID=A0ABR4V310_9GAMM|nr:hypothetical protein JV35_01315 [Pectobacterium betavasculorum]